MAIAYGRSYRLVVMSDPNVGSQQTITTYASDEWEPNALRISFDVQQQYSAVWQASIDIWNLNTESQTQAITTGSIVQLYAGYKDNTGLIFQGVVYQPLFERIGPDYRTTFLCIADVFGRTFVMGNTGAGGTQREHLATMAASAKSPVSLNLVQGGVREDAYLRGKVGFGSMRTVTNQIARDNGLQAWRNGNGMSLGDFGTSGASPTLVYATPDFYRTTPPDAGVNYTLIGSPQQTDKGVNFAVNLDPRLRFGNIPPMLVQLKSTLITPAAQQYGGTPIAPLQRDGVYGVAGVQHIGDSRGEEWATYVTGVTPGGYYSFLDSYSPSGGSASNGG